MYNPANRSEQLTLEAKQWRLKDLGQLTFRALQSDSKDLEEQLTPGAEKCMFKDLEQVTSQALRSSSKDLEEHLTDRKSVV